MRCGLTPALREAAEEIAKAIPDAAVGVFDADNLAFIKTLRPRIEAGGAGIHPAMLDLLDDLCAACAEEGGMEGIDLKQEEGSVARTYLRDAEVAAVFLAHARNTNRNDIALIEKARDMVR